jgi:hypothetical protein
MSERRVYVGDATATINSDGIVLSWPDGTSVPGCPHDTDSYRETAEDYGYGPDTMALCVEHELTHGALGAWLGVPSPVMLELRGSKVADPVVASREEAAVLAIQAYARAIGVDLTDRFEFIGDWGLSA